MKILTIEELFEPLGYTDHRSVREWCIKNNVLIIRRGKYEIVFETEFQLAYERPFINKLQNMFGKDWEQVYRLFKDGNIPALHLLSDITTKPIEIYKSLTEKENKFLKKLEAYERKKKNAA